MLTQERMPMLSDNYAWLLHEPEAGVTAVVDPAEAAPVLRRLQELGRRLDWILITHHHGDHTAGVPELVERTGCKVAGPAADVHRLPPLTVALQDGDRFELGRSTAEVIATPGHTTGHISFWFAAERLLFCADTLFALGCGRVIEGDMPMMWASLQKLAALPDEALVCCGHEYTQANARFALTIEPENPDLVRRAAEVDALRAQGQPTVPSTLGLERKTNPFLRAGSAARFGEIRRAKDRF